MADDKNLATELETFTSTKPVWLSRGVVLPALGIIGAILGVFGISLDDQSKMALADLADNAWAWIAGLSTIIGSIGGIYGRVKATSKVKL